MIHNAAGFELEPTPWSTHAACAGSNPELWFPERGETVQPALDICQTCPVRTECLDYAVRWRIDHGIWGGLASRQRRPLYETTARARRTPAPHGTTTSYARGCRCDGCRRASWVYKSQRILEGGHP